VDTLHLLVGEQTLDVSKGGGVGHVDRDGVAVTERDCGGELVERGPAVNGCVSVVENGGCWLETHV
jgi:hypothetical protein